MMVMREQWAGAMLLGAGMLIVPTLLKWRAILTPLRAAFAQFRSKPQLSRCLPSGKSRRPSIRGQLQHAAALLEAYMRHVTLVASSQQQIPGPVPDFDGDDDSGMTVKEALDVLGLPDGADLASVHAAPIVA